MLTCMRFCTCLCVCIPLWSQPVHTAVKCTGTSCVQGQRYNTEHVLDLGSGLLALLSFVLNCIGCHRSRGGTKSPLH